MLYFIIGFLIGLLLLIPAMLFDWDNCFFNIASMIIMITCVLGIMSSFIVGECDERNLISATPVEWDSTQKGFKRVEVSNLILKIYSHRNFFTFRKDEDRYSLVDTGKVVLQYKKYEDIVAYFIPKNEGVFVE